MNLEEFEQNIQETQEYIRNLLEQNVTVDPESDSRQEPIEELSVSVEELTVALEELHQQQEELGFAHQTIKLEKERYKKLFEFSRDGYLITNQTGVIQEANLSAAKMLNRNREILVGKPLVLFISRSDRIAFHNLLDKCEKAKQIQETVLCLRPHSKFAFPIKISVANISDDTNPLPVFLWSCHWNHNFATRGTINLPLQSL